MSIFSRRIVATAEEARLIREIGEAIAEAFDQRDARIAKLEERVEGLTKEVERLKSAPRMSLRQRLMERGIK